MFVREYGSDGDGMAEGVGENQKDQENKSKKEATRDYIGEVDSRGHTNIIISKEEKEHLARLWKKTLIMKLLIKRVGYMVLKKKIEMVWTRTGSILIIDVGNNFYFVKFHAKDDYEYAFTGGPWLIFDHYLALRSGRLGLNLQ